MGRTASPITSSAHSSSSSAASGRAPAIRRSEVEHHDAERAPGRGRPAQLRVQPFLEATPVEAAGQRVGAGHAGERIAAAVVRPRLPDAHAGDDASARPIQPSWAAPSPLQSSSTAR